jgi:hypothetical protein
MPDALSSGIGGGTVLAGVLAVGVLDGLVVVDDGLVELGVVVELVVVVVELVVVELGVAGLGVVELLVAAGLVGTGVTFVGSVDLATSLLDFEVSPYLEASLALELSPYLEASLDFAVSLVLLVLELDLAEAGVGDSLEPQALSSTSEAMVAKRTSMMFLRSDGSGHWSRPT